MPNNEAERRVLRILARLEGGYLALDNYDDAAIQSFQKTNLPLSRDQLWSLVNSLTEQGLVASILERLDGILVALTAKGRKMMEIEGASFDEEKVAETRRLFYQWLCKAEM